MRRVVNGRFLAKIASQEPYFLAKILCFLALFNLRQKMRRVVNGRFLAKIASQEPYFLAKVLCFLALFNL